MGGALICWREEGRWALRQFHTAFVSVQGSGQHAAYYVSAEPLTAA
jgi:hypothetical protein